MKTPFTQNSGHPPILNAVSTALSAMNLQGSGAIGGTTNTSVCTGGKCVATIDANGGVTYTQ
uniref:Uncharacterized protein n=1 Tax=mine drainage metagenome TaxID=410659 RepID=E6QD16_9ZZZZ